MERGGGGEAPPFELKHIQSNKTYKVESDENEGERVYHATSILSLIFVCMHTPLHRGKVMQIFAKLIITYHILPFLPNQLNSF